MKYSTKINKDSLLKIANESYEEKQVLAYLLLFTFCWAVLFWFSTTALLAVLGIHVISYFTITDAFYVLFN